MKTNDLINFECKGGEIVRIIKTESYYWFRASDILDIASLKWSQATLDRFGIGETKLLSHNGKSARFVSRSGLLALIAPKSEYAKVRKIIVELLDATNE